MVVQEAYRWFRWSFYKATHLGYIGDALLTTQVTCYKSFWVLICGWSFWVNLMTEGTKTSVTTKSGVLRWEVFFLPWCLHSGI